MRHWTPEEKARQSAAIRRWAPWRKSTGPRTSAGKEISRYNALKHGFRSRGARNLWAALMEHQRFLSRVQARFGLKIKNSANELLKDCTKMCKLGRKSGGVRMNLKPRPPPDPFSEGILT